MTNKELEELNRQIIKICRCCDSTDVSVRYAKPGWYFVGCLACENKTLCDEAMVHEVVRLWNTRTIRWAHIVNKVIDNIPPSMI